MKFVAALLGSFVLVEAFLAVFGQQPEECEFILIANETVDSFATPNYPEPYPNHLNCVWIVKAPNPDQKVEILFSVIDTEACCDFIHIRDGESSASPILFPASGNRTKTRYFVSTYDALRVSFSSDDSITKSGFHVQYHIAVTQDFPECGGDVTATPFRQSLSSPGWPGYYKNNLFCLWTIRASDPDHMVVLTFVAFQLETCCDSVLVRDGSDVNAKTVAYVRGRGGRARPIVSSNNTLQVRFRSDQSHSFRGFYAIFESVPRGNMTATIPEDPECGGELVAPPNGHENFTSPNYPKAYQSSSQCVWVIRASEGERVRVWFSYVDTERCCDWIKVRDGAEFDSDKLGVISGYPITFNSYVSSSNVIRVEFDTDSSVQERGFFAYYETYKPTLDISTSSCGGNLNADSNPQYFSSPNFPNGTYPVGVTCSWIIRSPFGTQVRIKILGVILETFLDTLTVYNGGTTLSKRIVTLTGKHPHKFTITTGGNEALVVLSSSRRESHAGFRATYEAVERQEDVTSEGGEPEEPK